MAVTSAVISLLLTAAGTAYTARQQYKAGKTQEAIEKRKAEQRKVDALGRQQETLAQAREKRIQNQRDIARKKMIFAGRGIQLEGTPLEILAEDAGRLEMQALEIERLGEKESSDLLTLSEWDLYRAKAARTAGKVNSTATLFQGAQQLAGTTTNLSVAGVF